MSAPSTLPTWAPGFAHAVHPDDDHWIIETAQGEAQFTLLFPQDAPEEAIADQMAVVEAELQAVRALCE